MRRSRGSPVGLGGGSALPSTHYTLRILKLNSRSQKQTTPLLTIYQPNRHKQAPNPSCNARQHTKIEYEKQARQNRSSEPSPVTQPTPNHSLCASAQRQRRKAKNHVPSIIRKTTITMVKKSSKSSGDCTFLPARQRKGTVAGRCLMCVNESSQPFCTSGKLDKSVLMAPRGAVEDHLGKNVFGPGERNGLIWEYRE
ncbi:hypothetical protein BDV19DRAFT_362676 [Aspergillus venezuelensis]